MARRYGRGSRYSQWGWEEWPRYQAAPRRPADGVRAQTQRGQFGATWWAGRWIAALERLVDAARLSRGRSYARSGQIVQLDVGRGGVNARVQGSRPKPYQVRIQFKPLSETEWDQVAEAMAAEALYAAQLLSGEMPEQIEQVFTAAGASLLPAAQGDLETSCSCPDWANPCKHVAAVHYLLGERFDADPFLMFELRGRSKEDIITALRTRRASEASAVKEIEEGAERYSAALDAAAPLRESVATFWSAPDGLPELDAAFVAPPLDALAVKRLGAPPFWRGQRDFTALMEGAYRDIGAYALRLALGED